MCGRFENKMEPDKIITEVKKIFQVEDLTEGFKFDEEDIRPTTPVISVINNDNTLQLRKAMWGIKFSDKSPLIFNSRIETIKEKPYWNSLFHKNRALIPMSAFYEWPIINGKKVQHRISVPGISFFFVPALFHQSKGVFFISLITVTPNSFMQKIHHRMPVILLKEEVSGYFSTSSNENLNLCIPFRNEIEMCMEPVLPGKFNLE